MLDNHPPTPPPHYTVTSLFNAPLETFCNLFGSLSSCSGISQAVLFQSAIRSWNSSFPLLKLAHMFTLLLSHNAYGNKWHGPLPLWEKHLKSSYSIIHAAFCFCVTELLLVTFKCESAFVKQPYFVFLHLICWGNFHLIGFYSKWAWKGN